MRSLLKNLPITCSTFILGCFLISLFLGCGVKAPPVVPHAPIPQTIMDLEAFSHRGKIILQWSIPQKDSNGKRLTSLGGFRIWRQFTPPEDEDCPTCQADYKILVDIDYQSLEKMPRDQGMITYRDNPDKKEGKYVYKIISYTTSEVESSVSNAAAITWSPPLPPPFDLNATPGDRFVHLTWKLPPTPERNGNRKKLGGFNIYRRYPGQQYRLTPLNQKPVQRIHFSDVSVANGERYYYVVRSLKITDDGLIESRDSAEIEAIPEDCTPPAPPFATTTYQSPEGIVLVWEPNLETDLEGYHVYRRLETEATPTLLYPHLIKKTMFLDKTFSPGVTYYYSVTAVDRSPRHNESDFSQELKMVTETP